jgi:hydrogenase maturation protein HypF
LHAITAVVHQLAEHYTFDTVALSGGCLQNRILLEGLELAFRASGLRCLSHEQVPANDGGIALGQAAIAAATLIQSMPLASIQSQSQHNNMQSHTQGDAICV